MSAGNEQTELRALADWMVEEGLSGSYWGDCPVMLRRAADRLDRLTTLVAHLRPDPPDSEDYYT